MEAWVKKFLGNKIRQIWLPSWQPAMHHFCGKRNY